MRQPVGLKKNSPSKTFVSAAHAKDLEPNPRAISRHAPHVKAKDRFIKVAAFLACPVHVPIAEEQGKQSPILAKLALEKGVLKISSASRSKSPLGLILECGLK
jgi:hypothetical protein